MQWSLPQPMNLLQQIQRQRHPWKIHVEILVQPDRHLCAAHAAAAEAPLGARLAARLDHALGHQRQHEVLAGVAHAAELLELQLQ